MSASDNNEVRSGFITAVTAALFIAVPSAFLAQSSPLTVQPSTGRVGIGTTAPNSKIEAKGTDVGVSVMNNAGTQNYYFGIKDSDGNKLYVGRGRDPSQGVAPAITVDTTDNVGVGAAAPGYKLDVSGTVNATAFRGDGSQLTNLPGGGGGGSAALDKVTANTTVTNTTAETTLYSFSVPGGTLGTNNVLRLTIQITDLDLPDGASVTLRFKYGGTTLTSVDPFNESGSGMNNRQALITVIIAADGTTNAQLGSVFFQATQDFGPYVRQGTSAIDSTAAQTLAVTVDWDVSSTGRSITLGQAILEKLS